MDNRQVVIHKHFAKLAEQYPMLALTAGDDDTWIVQGLLEFSATYEDVGIRDAFHIELIIPKDYPDIPPSVTEIGGRIPKEFHKHANGSLCLGAPLEVRMKFAQNPSLLGFVNEQVIPFLFSFCYSQQHGKMPFGERSHGGKGILEYYIELFNATSEIVTIAFLKILAENNYKGHFDCPCGSRKRIRDCHGGTLRDISSYQQPDEFLYDYGHGLIHLQRSGQKIPKSLVSEELMNRIKKHSHELEKKMRSAG